MDWMGVFVELPSKLTLGKKVLQMADLVLALPNSRGLGHQCASAWLLGYPCQPGLSQNGSGLKGPHRITEWVRLKGTTGEHLVQPPC